MAYTDNYVVGVFAEDRMIAASVAFLGLRDGRLTLFSNQVAVIPGQASRGVGLRIHQHMRQWALDRGIQEINWTFDPMIVRNAYFFIHKVGADGIRYLPDFYGGSYDPGNDASDRIFAVWDLATDEPSPSIDACDVPVALRAGDGVQPVVDLAAAEARTFAIEPPADIKVLRATDAVAANRWRVQVRNIVGAALDGGGRLVDVTRDGRYVIEQ